jgi:hypothetical protein
MSADRNDIPVDPDPRNSPMAELGRVLQETNEVIVRAVLQLDQFQLPIIELTEAIDNLEATLSNGVEST